MMIKTIFKLIIFDVIYIILYAVFLVSFNVLLQFFILNEDVTQYISKVIAYALIIIIEIVYICKNKTNNNTSTVRCKLVETLNVIVLFGSQSILLSYVYSILSSTSIDATNYCYNINITDSVFRIICSVLLTSIAEELLYRKIMFNIMKDYNWLIKLIISTLIFVYAHLPSSIYSAVNLLIGALMLGLIYILTDNIAYCIIGHAIHNVSSLVFEALSYKKILPYFNADGYTIYIFNNMVGVITLILFLATMIYIKANSCNRKNFANNKRNEQEVKE